MRLTPTGQYDMDIPGNGVQEGVFEIIPGPELAVVESRPEIPDERDQVGKIIHGITEVPPLPHSDRGKDGREEYEN